VKIYEIAAEYMKANGFTALYRDDCGCTLDDFMPCGGECAVDCEVGHANDCTTCAGRDECPTGNEYDVMCREDACYKQAGGEETT